MITARPRTTAISLGELKVSADPAAILACLGLGSCVAIAAYDPHRRLAGMAHCVLPASERGHGEQRPARYVDRAVPLLVQEMERQGSSRRRLIIKMVGGARVLRGRGFESVTNVGQQNVQAAREAFQRLGLKLSGEDIGGDFGRTVRLYVEDGRVEISTIQTLETVLQ
ncbi:MAG TPA: chemotaxis protein CheD [Dehalococcoidia bacterium]|jgi:chemotaxis protein CheD|nr:chemotaxis protein CheD [Dehalococcoidia bacterium]